MSVRRPSGPRSGQPWWPKVTVHIFQAYPAILLDKCADHGSAAEKMGFDGVAPKIN